MFSLFLIGFAVFLAAATAPLVLVAWVLRTRQALRAKRGDAAAAAAAGASSKKRLRIGFFHPYSTGGGGGERVLWTLLAAVQKVHGAECDITLYTHWVDSAMRKKTSAELAAIVSKKFGITLRSDVPLEIVPLEKIAWVEASSYPRVTLLLQSLGALPLGYEAVSKKPVDVFIDTMGYAFTYPLVKLLLGPVKVVSYTHYPTVSTDMLQAVQSARATHNNSSSIAQSRVMTTAKVLYYRAFALLYGWCGGFCDAAMVNSTWTRGHIRSLWRLASTENEADARNRLHLVFPPCDCSQLRILAKPQWDPAAEAHEVCLVSVAQFRPEKDHPLQLRALRTMLARMDSQAERRRVVLHLVGGVRDEGDRQRVAALRELAEELGVAAHVKFHVDLVCGGGGNEGDGGGGGVMSGV